MEEVLAAVDQAERRMAELGDKVDSTVDRSEAVSALSERANRVMTDIRQGERTLSNAVRQLDGSSPELCVKERGSSSMLRLGCLGELLGLEE